MKPRVRIAFAHFWQGFTPEAFSACFPYVAAKYDLVVSDKPDVVFYSVFVPQAAGQRRIHPAASIPPGDYVRVFLTGENIEPVMEHCEFAISFSALIDHPNHLRLPLWVYDIYSTGQTPEQLVKAKNTDWEQVAAGKDKFCNFVYSNNVPFRNRVFASICSYKPVDSAGRCLNNMGGWLVPSEPSRLAGKLEFMKRYRFTLAVENAIWPGYMTEKFVHPMVVNSIPIYVGDPLARSSFDTAGYIDITSFGSLKHMVEFVREVDSNPALYIKLLAAPFYRDNIVPAYARAECILPFFDRVFSDSRARQ
jgi:hypothetical protein